MDEDILDDEELSVLDKEIDEWVRTFELLRASRRFALRTLLTEFDAWVQHYGLNQDLAQRTLDYRAAYTGFNHAVRWIFVHCPIRSTFIPEEPELAARELLIGYARDYSAIYAQMSLAFRKRNQIARLSASRYRITSANSENLELETARSLIAVGRYPELAEDTLDLPADAATRIQREISLLGVTGRQLRYSIPDEIYEEAHDTMKGRKLYLWEMNAAWDLGGYSFGDLRQVWETLKTLQSLHQLALQKLPRQQDRRRLNIRAQGREMWVEEIARRSKLKYEIVNRIFADLIYDERLHSTGRKRAHVMYQPFFELGEDEIAQSNSLVLMSVAEKCAWILTELLRPAVHDRLKTLKERHWIDNDFKALESETLKVYPHINYTFENKSGDLDLLLLDTAANFGLAAQLKWTTSVDTPAGVKSDDDQYAKGIEQATRSLNWAEQNREELARRIGLSPEKLRSTVLRPIVIAKETLPSGAFPISEVPVINEAIFRWIMKDPHNATLERLWQVASASSYLPREGVHFRKFSPESISWGALEFILDDVAYIPLERWRPEVDIRFE